MAFKVKNEIMGILFAYQLGKLIEETYPGGSSDPLRIAEEASNNMTTEDVFRDLSQPGESEKPLSFQTSGRNR